MNRLRHYTTTLVALAALCTQAQVTPTSQMEKLDRGLVAVPTSSTANFVSWRLLGTDDKAATTFDLMRNGTVIASGLTKTNFQDNGGSSSAKYQVVTKINGTTKETSNEVTPWGKKYLTLTLDRPATGAQGGTYTPNDMSIADVDGDGQYELFVKWDPANSKDNSQEGVTDNVYLDAYRMNGTKLWRIDLGRNIRAGAHYTQFLVYDFNGDGKAELMCKTAPGSKDGQGQYVNQAATDESIKGHDNTKSYGNSKGYVNDGPEYLTVFDGETGRAIHTTWYLPNRAGNFNQVDAHPSSSSYWGDSYGGRSDRFLASVAYINGADKQPCGIFSRGYYSRAFIWAVSFDGSKIHTEWLHDSYSKYNYYVYQGDELTKLNDGKAFLNMSNTSGAKSADGTQNVGSNTMFGNGNHNLSVADVDGDGKDEILWGAAALDDDGKLLYATGYGHGDAIHVGKMIPDREGLQVFDVHEEKLTVAHGSWDLHDAATGEIIHHGGNPDKDNGRGMAGDLTGKDGYEFWSQDSPDSEHSDYTQYRYPRSATTGNVVISKSCSVNFRIYWDGDAADELFDGSYKDGKASPYIQKWNGSSFTNVVANFNTADYNYGQTCNTTKATPCLQADLLGDWREELIMWNLNNPAQINIYTTTVSTEHAVPTLMHDHTYRMGITWQQTAYNQPPHLGYYLPDYLSGKLDTGMQGIQISEKAGTQDSSWYTINGQKLNSKPMQKGIYIHNGRKVIL